jgi:DNA polymerase-3 subunit delta'
VQFRDIPNQTALKEILRQSVQRGHVAHAQLFRGAEGSAALALALAYAQYLNCEGRTDDADDSCGHCPACLKIGKLAHPDLNFVLPHLLGRKPLPGLQRLDAAHRGRE